jgi:hypothetical protein
MSGGRQDMQGQPVPESEVANDLGFKGVADFRAWQEAGSPIGKCSNDRCGRMPDWRDHDKPCKHCGSPVEVIPPPKPRAPIGTCPACGEEYYCQGDDTTWLCVLCHHESEKGEGS